MSTLKHQKNVVAMQIHVTDLHVTQRCSPVGSLGSSGCSPPAQGHAAAAVEASLAADAGALLGPVWLHCPGVAGYGDGDRTRTLYTSSQPDTWSPSVLFPGRNSTDHALPSFICAGPL